MFIHTCLKSSRNLAYCLSLFFLVRLRGLGKLFTRNISIFFFFFFFIFFLFLSFYSFSSPLFFYFFFIFLFFSSCVTTSTTFGNDNLALFFFLIYYFVHQISNVSYELLNKFFCILLRRSSCSQKLSASFFHSCFVLFCFFHSASFDCFFVFILFF